MSAFWRWSLFGGVIAVVLLIGQASAVGGLEGLLQVGEQSEMRPAIEDELGEVPLAPFSGHDGQIYFVIASDLTGSHSGPEVVDHPAYRYRRILFPAVAGGFGLLEGKALLVGMVVTVVVSMAVAAGAVAACSRLLGSSDWLALAVVMNPGVWLSVRLLTADVFAIALMCLGLLGYLARPAMGIAAFSLSVLAKEPYLLTPAGLSVSKDRQRWLFTLIPVSVLALWTVWVGLTIYGGTTGETGNLSLPFVGIVEGAFNWPYVEAGDWVYLVFALVSTVAALVLGVFHRGWLRWSLLGWGLLGACASDWVWRVGNNSARSVAPIAILIVLAVAARRQDPRPGQPRPTSTEDRLTGSLRDSRER